MLLFTHFFLSSRIVQETFRWFRYLVSLLVLSGLVFFLLAISLTDTLSERFLDPNNAYFFLVWTMLLLTYLLPLSIFIPRFGRLKVVVVICSLFISTPRIAVHISDSQRFGQNDYWTYFFTSVDWFTIVEGLILASIIAFGLQYRLESPRKTEDILDQEDD